MPRQSLLKRLPGPASLMTWTLALSLGLLAGRAGALLSPADDAAPVLRPAAVVETEPVPSEGDAADDPAIWVHPTDPSLSLVLGTDKKGGLNVFDLDGHRRQIVGAGSMPNNVDIVYGVPMGAGSVDLAIAGTRSPARLGLTAWRIDPATRQVLELGSQATAPVLGGTEPYGSCVYRSPRDGAVYAFVTSKEGVVEQHRLTLDTTGALSTSLVRTLHVGSQVEGCVADDEAGALYVAEEDVAIWRYAAEPDGGQERRLVARVGEHGLAADIEGLTLYAGPEGRGYLIASSQGNHTFPVFERAGDNRFVATIDPAPGAIGDLGETDGLAVTAAPTSPRFGAGLLVIQDGVARDGRQNFKFFDWRDVAGGLLRVEPMPPTRPR